MDRNYYSIKALVVALAIGVALFSCGCIGSRGLDQAEIRVHYAAAATLQDALTDASARVSRAVGDLARHAMCDIENLID